MDSDSDLQCLHEQYLHERTNGQIDTRPCKLKGKCLLEMLLEWLFVTFVEGGGISGGGGGALSTVQQADCSRYILLYSIFSFPFLLLCVFFNVHFNIRSKCICVK